MFKIENHRFLDFGCRRSFLHLRYALNLITTLLILVNSVATHLHAQETGIIRGTVIDQNNLAADSARITVSGLGSNAEQFEVETGEDGRYVQETIPVGTYAIMVDKEGMSGESFVIRVHEGRTVNVNLKLEPGRRMSTWVTGLAAREALSSVFAAGVEASRSRDFEEAIDLFHRTIELNPNCIECNFNLAVAYVEVGQLADAEARFKQIIEIRPDYPAAYYGLSDIYIRQNRREEAIRVRGEANRLALERISTGRVQATDATQRGLTFLNAGNVADAQRRFREALNRDINYAPAHYWLGISLLQSDSRSEAADSFNKYLQLEVNGDFSNEAREHLASIRP